MDFKLIIIAIINGFIGLLQGLILFLLMDLKKRISELDKRLSKHIEDREYHCKPEVFKKIFNTVYPNEPIPSH